MYSPGLKKYLLTGSPLKTFSRTGETTYWPAQVPIVHIAELFAAFWLSPEGAFRLKGEQIDGSFLLNNETYLVEAKWCSAKTGNADLHVFQGKLEQKVAWARGVFISWAGFTRDGLEAWGKGKRVICVSGYDLVLILKFQVTYGGKNTSGDRNRKPVRQDRRNFSGYYYIAVVRCEKCRTVG